MKRNLGTINEMHQRSYDFLGGIIVGATLPRYSDPMKGRH